MYRTNIDTQLTDSQNTTNLVILIRQIKRKLLKLKIPIKTINCLKIYLLLHRQTIRIISELKLNRMKTVKFTTFNLKFLLYVVKNLL